MRGHARLAQHRDSEKMQVSSRLGGGARFHPREKLIDVTTAGDRIYLVVYAGPKADATLPKATRMRESFKLLGK